MGSDLSSSPVTTFPPDLLGLSLGCTTRKRRVASPSRRWPLIWHGGGGAQSLTGQRHQTDIWTQKSVESPKTTWFHFLPGDFGCKINMSETNVTVPGRRRRVFFVPGHRAGSETLMVKQHEQFHACGASTGLLPLENTMMSIWVTRSDSNKKALLLIYTL